MERAENQDIKKFLKRTWYAFFNRAGPLSPFRKTIIMTVLEGKSALIMSQEREGIPEAVLAPLCEKALEEKKKGPSVLYLTPSRARANETFERLREQLARPGLRVSKKTADRAGINAENPPDILVTTPEALDSLLCRQPEGLEELKSVVLDMAHLIDGNYRGDQTRILLERLREISGGFSVYALSALCVNALQLGERYMEDFLLILDEGERDIKETKETYAASLEEVLELTAREKLKKILVFCASREEAEETGALLEKLRKSLDRNYSSKAAVRLAVHHQGLSGVEREEVRNFMKNSERAICVSVLTPDPLIEIGKADAVVFAGVPGDFLSFIQGMECAGKGTEALRAFFPCDSRSKPLLELMLSHAKEKLAGKTTYYQDLSVAVQQIFSVLFSNPWGVDEDYVYGLFNRFCAYEDLKSIIEELLAAGLISSRNRKIYASEFIMNLGEEGILHSCIPQERAFEVINSRTNKKIGEARLLPGCTGAGQSFFLAGKFWEVTKAEEENVRVKKSTVKAVFSSMKTAAVPGAFFEYLPEKLQGSEIEKRKGL